MKSVEKVVIRREYINKICGWQFGQIIETVDDVHYT